jgi:hypothetical protein
MFTAALFTIAMEISYGNSQDTPLPTNGLKKCGVYIHNGILATKNKILSFAGKWKNWRT